MAKYTIDIPTIEALATAKRDSFEVMRYQLEYDDDLDDSVIDNFVDAIAQPIVEAIDCTQCGNCCKALTVELYPEDVPRLGEGLGTNPQNVDEKYIQHEDLPEADMWGIFRQQPCALLRELKCSVYKHRPEACRDFPLFTPDFRWTLDYTIKSAKICPIVYHVLDAMLEKVDVLQTSS